MQPVLAPPQPTVERPAVCDSLVALLAARVADARERPAVVDGLEPTLSWTWGDIAAAAVELAERLDAAGLRRGDRVAHVGPHSPDWIVVDLACLLAGVVHVAVHDDLPARERRRLLDWLAPQALVCSSRPPHASPRELPSLDLGPGVLAATAWRGLAADPARLADALARRVAACDPDACCTILLSSGTTGLPHGVLHSQRSLAVNARASSEMFLHDPRDVRLSWLPMSHAYARVGDLYTALVRGGCLNVVRDRMRLLDACAALPPAVILGVPAFFERLERGTRAGRIADLAAALGGRVRACISGGAPLRDRTAAFFLARGVPLVQGYGLAEAGPVVAVSNPRIARPGTVGPPLDGVEVRIDERPGSRGQLLVRTPSRALGLLDAPDASGAAATAGDPDWLETGDVAEIDLAGHVRITGRISDMLVLSTGLKVPPAEIERTLAEDEAVAQVCVVGDGLPWPVALVVPEPDVIRAAIRRLGLRVFSRRQAVTHPRLLAWIARRLAHRQARLPRAWQVRRVILVGRAFDAAHGEATESFKLKRPAIASHFHDPIQAAAREGHRGAGVVPVGPRVAGTIGEAGVASRHAWLTGATWHGTAGGYAEAAATAVAPLPDAVEAVLDRTALEIAALRAAGQLYEPLPAVAPAAPLADPPPAPTGCFTAAAEAALGAAGLWGLFVPQPHGAAATLGQLARGITRVAADCPTAAGMLAVHSSIGAVSAVTAFGSAEQRARHLPDLAAGRPLSIFGGTEPDVGCDLGAVQSVLERRDGRLLLTGTKMFITNAVHGRLVKLLALHDGKPAVVLVRLPDHDTPSFRLRHYALHPLKHAANAALEFTAFEVDEADLLAPPPGRDGMQVVWHGLNRGRITLAAQAAGTLRLLLAQACDHAARRTTWGRPIAARELVQGRLGRIAASITACDAITAWAAAAIDAGQTGELEAITAKVVASTCVREAAVDALGVHGGRAFLVGHPLGDSLHDHFAVTIYEGESDLLGLALFKGLAKHHPLAEQARDAGRLAQAGDWLAWRAARFAADSRGDAGLLDGQLRDHARRARRGLAAAAVRIDRAIRRHGRGLADRQLEIGALAADVREFVCVLTTAHHADASGTDDAAAAADVWCRLALARAAGRRLTSADHAAVAALGRKTSPVTP
jgi:long-subunit acyl-CoA synthetase (AMP-forming)/alkylation response protein AidB-like acyl-CoA dehydrogenase